MELQIIILTFAVVALGICYVFVSCESSRNKYRIRDLETEVEHLKALVNTNDKFVDKTYDGLIECSDQVRQLRKELQILEGIQSKMSDELFKMNDLDKRIDTLEKSSKINIPIQGQTLYPPCYFENGICTNPFHDCVGCPRQFGGGTTITTTDRTQFKKD